MARVKKSADGMARVKILAPVLFKARVASLPRSKVYRNEVVSITQEDADALVQLGFAAWA